MPQQQEQTWTIRRLLEWTSGFFTRKNVDPARLSAELLLAHVLGVPRIKLYTDYERILGDSQLAQFRALKTRNEAVNVNTARQIRDKLLPPPVPTTTENLGPQINAATGGQSAAPNGCGPGSL